MAEMTEDEADALSQATADALGAVDYDVSRWKEAGAVAPGVVALLYTWFSNEVFRNGLVGWVHGYAQKGEHRVLAALTRMNAARDPDMADILLEVFTRVDRLLASGAEVSSLPYALNLLLWERPSRRVSFGLAAAAHWNAEVDPLSLPPPEWAPARTSRLAPSDGPIRYPGVAVGLSPRGAQLAVRMEKFDTFDYANVVGAVIRGLWRAGVADEELDRFEKEANADRPHLGEVCARWILFDGDGGDAARFQHIHDTLYPPDPLLPFFPGVSEWSGVFLLPGSLSERIQAALPGPACTWLTQSADELVPAVSAALRWAPDAIGVLRGDTASAADSLLFERLLAASQAGIRVVVLGMRDDVRRAFRLEAERLSCRVQEPSMA